MKNNYSIYDYYLTSELLDRCDGPVNVDVIAGRVTEAVKEGKYSPDEIANASIEALNILKAHGGYISSNEFGR
jgi:hypothetical protein